jgi:hypothetical protein
MDTPPLPTDPDMPMTPGRTETAPRQMRILASAPDFLPPLDGESAMLLHLLGQAFTDLIEGA